MKIEILNFLENAGAYADENSVFTKVELVRLAKKLGINPKSLSPLFKQQHRVQRGKYSFESIVKAFPMNKNDQKQAESTVSNIKFIPEVDEKFVAWGEFSTINKIVKSEMFYPTYVFGLSGNGKTYMVEQAAAKASREYIRVQITPETDEDDLIGGFRLVDGDTVFAKGPVLKAMENGAILLLDEIDRATNKIMCLQGILEGKPYLVKKTGEIVKPVEGFNIIATANTQGRGSSDGRFTAATIIDEAFLERFTVAIEQDYPTKATESKILLNHMNQYDMELSEEMCQSFANKLVEWSSIIRKTYMEDGIDDLISTRRLCHIVQTYAIFKDEMKSIKMCITRFDAETREAFLDLYDKLQEAQ